MTRGTHGINVGEPHGDIYGTTLDDVLKRLPPPDQRLVRELVFRLAAQRGACVPPSQPLDLTAYIESWANFLLVEGKSPGTVRQYRLCVQKLLREQEHPTLASLQDFLAARAREVEAGAVGNYIFALRSFFGFLHRRAEIESNPTEHLKAPRRPHRERQIPTPYQVARLTSAPCATPKDRAIVLVLAACGLRVSELLTARRTDVQLADPASIRVIGKGNKQRTVPMAREAAYALEEYLRTLPLGCMVLFPGRNPQRVMTAQAIDDRFKNLCMSAEIPRISPHQLRHYFASVLLSRGVNIKIVSRLMGHASPTVTADTYWHLLDEGELVRAYREGNPLKQIQDEMARLANDQLGFDFRGHDFGTGGAP